MTRRRLLAIVMALLLVLPGISSLITPATTSAQDDDGDAIAAWRADLPNPFQLMPGQPTTLRTAEEWAEAGAAARRLADSIADAETPAAAEPARDALVDGYSYLGDYFDGWSAMIRTMTLGQFYTYDTMADVIVALGNGRVRLVEGFRLAADLAVARGVADGVADPGRDGCGGVDVWLATGDAMMRSWWSYWQAWYAESRRLAQRSNVPIETLVGNWELAANFTFQNALTLAVTPSPEGAAGLNAALATLFQDYSTIYLLGMSGVWAGYLGTTPAITQRLTDDYNARVSMAIDDYVALQQSWSEVAEKCGSASLLVDMPREVTGAG